MSQEDSLVASRGSIVNFLIFEGVFRSTNAH